MDSLRIQKWVHDVNHLFISENELDFDFMKQVEKDQTWIIELLSEYDVNDKVFKLYQFEMFAMQYKSLAKQFTEIIKPTLPKAWMGTSQERPRGRIVAKMFFGELEHAFLDLAAKKFIFDKVVATFTNVWAIDKKNWMPREFVENTWVELSNLKM